MTTTIDALTETLTEIEASAHRLSGQAVTGVISLDPVFTAYLDAKAGDLCQPAAAAWAEILAVSEKIQAIRTEADDLAEEARQEVAAYARALHAGASDPAQLPDSIPNLDRHRVKIEALGIAFRASCADLNPAHDKANALAPSLRFEALTAFRGVWHRATGDYLRAVAVMREAFETMDRAESAALSLDPVLGHRLDVVHRYAQDVSFVKARRADARHALDAALASCVYSSPAMTLLTSDGWLRGHERVAFQAAAPEPLPVEPSPIPGADVADDVVPAYTPDPAEWEDGAWSDGFVPAQKPRARRKVTTVEEVSA